MWKLALVLITFTFIGSIFLNIYSDKVVDYVFSQRQDSEIVARLLKASGPVKRRGSFMSYWTKVTDEIPLYNGEQIWTGADGRAAIQFLDGSLAEIAENSLVILSSRDNFVLDEGSVDLALPKDQKLATKDLPFRIKGSGGKVTLTRDTEGGIELKTDSKIELENIETGEKVAELEANSVVDMKSDGNLGEVRVLWNLEIGKIDFNDKGEARVSLKWSELAGPQTWIVVYDSQTLNRDLQRKKVSETEDTLMVPYDNETSAMYLRLEDEEGLPLSHTKRIVLEKQRDKAPVHPTPGQIFVTSKGKLEAPVKFSWPDQSSQKAKVVVAKDKDTRFKNRLAASISQTGPVVLSLPAGAYRWRVEEGSQVTFEGPSFQVIGHFTIEESGREISSSEKEVDQLKNLGETLPEPEAPKELLLQNQSPPSEKEELEGPDALQSESDATSQAQTDAIPEPQPVPKPSTKPSPKPKKTKAIKTPQPTTPKPEPPKEPVVLVKPKLLFPQNDSLLMSGGAGHFLFSWSEQKGTTGYTFQVADDENFNNVILEKETKTNSTFLEKLPKGLLYWRVRAKEGDSNISEWSAPQKVRH